VETSDHLKNGATPKSQMSRKVTSIEMKTLNVTSDFWRQRIFRHGKILTILSGTFLLVFIYGCASLVSENYKSRIRAVNKLTDPNILYTVAKDDGNYYVREAALKKLTQSQLAKLTTESISVNIRLRAVYYLTDQNDLMSVSQNNDSWDVRKEAFKKLNNNSLDILTREAKDPALKLSAKIRLGQISWNTAFSGAGGSTGKLGDVIGAAALVDSPQPTSSDVVSACHKFIREGDASRIPELINLLNRFGNVTLAEDYMNCGQSTLSDAGCAWGRAHGYKCTTGSGSHRVKWGSGK